MTAPDEPNALDLPQDQAAQLRHVCHHIAIQLAPEIEAAIAPLLTRARRDGYATGYLARLAEEPPKETRQP